MSEYTEVGYGSDRLEMLGYNILILISAGRFESVDNIIAHFATKDIVHYLIKKYADDMYFVNENSPYNIEDWEELFSKNSYMTFEDNVSRKYGLHNRQRDGLLLMVALILEKVADRKYK